MADKKHAIPSEGLLSSNNNGDSAKSSHFESGRKIDKVKVGPSKRVIYFVNLHVLYSSIVLKIES